MTTADWQRPTADSEGLRRYVAALREHLKLIAATVALVLLVAIAYLAVTPKTYQAEADLLVTPISGDSAAASGLGLIRESNDPTRDVETAARLVTTRDVAARARAQARSKDSIDDLLGRTEATPVAQSNIVAVTAKAASAGEARNLANAFADGVVAQRTEVLRAQLGVKLPALRRQLAAEGSNPQTGPGTLTDQISQLESLNAGSDPTIRVETRAATPPSPVAPRPALTIAAALIGGLVIGIGGAFAAHTLDPRLRREEQLRESYTLPVLGRIPEEKGAALYDAGTRHFGIGTRRKRRKALGAASLSPLTLEAYRTLRAMLTARPSRGRAGRSVLVTGPSPSEGKTTTAINLATSLALAGKRVILIEADFRRPTAGEALDARPVYGLGKVLLGSVTLDEALVPIRPFGDALRALLVTPADQWLTETLSLPAAGELLNQATTLADYVVVDSPPLTEVIDALPLAQQVDDVLVVLRLGQSNMSRLSRLSDLLAQNAIMPTGFVLVGVGTSEQEGYYLKARRERSEELAELAASGTSRTTPRD